MVQTPVETVTLGDFLQQPETKPASEYIDGEIVQKPMLKIDHSAIQANLIKAVDAALGTEQIGRAFPELRCTFGTRSIVPDVVVLPWNDIPRNEKGRLSGELFDAPLWMIEILSEGQSHTRVAKKILYSLKHGTQIGWLIDPEEECVFVYTDDLRSMRFMKKRSNHCLCLILPKTFRYQITVGELVGWLYE